MASARVLRNTEIAQSHRGEANSGKAWYGIHLFTEEFTEQWQVRLTAHGAALRDMADSKSRRPSAQNRSFTGADVKAGDSVSSRKVVIRKSATWRRGKALTLDIGETGATVKFQSRTFKVSRYCV